MSTDPIRPRRSVLYVPGSNERALAKAPTLQADALILDLEDSVAPDAKDAARDAVADVLAAVDFSPAEVTVRVNPLDGPWGMDDLAMVATSRADALVLPKVDGPDDVRAASAELAVHGGPNALRLWCTLETPRGVLSAAEIAGADERVAALVMGTSDLAKELHAAHTPAREPLLASLSLCVLAARAHGLAALDGVHLDVLDLEGLEAACRQGRALGFDGKTLIHPSTIDVANRVFAPSADEIAWARRVVDAHEKARAAGMGVAVVEGRLVEALHVEEARRTLALAEAIERI